MSGAVANPAWDLAVAGWALAALLSVVALRLRRRLDLVADAEHELRGPVTAMALAAEAIERAPDRRRHAVALDGHLERLKLALSDLEAAREGRRTPPRPVTVPLEHLLGRAAAGWDPAATRAGGGIRLDPRVGAAAVRADRARLSQALDNVVANAVEHGGAAVGLSARNTAGGVRLEVRDGGASDRPAVPAARSQRRGRGLRLARRAVAEAGGRLIVDHTPAGATVVMELPAAAVEREPDNAA